MKSCPRCATALEETAVGTVHVDGCPGCGGVWFDNKELGVVAQAQKAQLKALEDQFQPVETANLTQGDMNCPVCQVALFPFEFPHTPGIKLDACPKCRGIWADNGELQAINAQVVARHAVPRSETATSTMTTTLQKAHGAVRFFASVTCPRCGQNNPTSSISCWACSTSLKNSRDLTCPVCAVPLTTRTFFGKELDICLTCCGIWLDQNELSPLLRREPNELIPLERELDKPVVSLPGAIQPGIPLACPVCSLPMQEQEYGYRSGIRIDACNSCAGIWLGTGELSRLIRYYNQVQRADRDPQS